MQDLPKMIRMARMGALAAFFAGCSSAEPPKEVSVLAVSIDAANNCSLEDTPVQCERVAEIIKTRHPTSKPRVDICLDKQARYEAAVEVMNSVSAAGLTVGNFDCGKAGG